jgi:primosomal protein N'
MMAQTSLPEEPLLTALRRGEPLPYLEDLLGERARLGFPPVTDMLAIEVRGGDEPARFDGDLRSLGATAALGPAESPQGWRWLLQGSLGPVKAGLRPVVQRWRESGATVRIDADPIDF